MICVLRDWSLSGCGFDSVHRNLQCVLYFHYYCIRFVTEETVTKTLPRVESMCYICVDAIYIYIQFLVYVWLFAVHAAPIFLPVDFYKWIAERIAFEVLKTLSGTHFV